MKGVLFEESAARGKSGVFDGRLMVFLHIPKTAGTTLRLILASHPLLSVRLMRGHRALKEAVTEDPSFMAATVSRHDVLMGHFVYDRTIYGSLGERVLIVALIRDPVARAISHFRHVRRTPGHPLHDALRDLSFDEAFVSHDRFRQQVSNNQVRVLCRDTNLAALLDVTRAHRMILGRIDRFEAFLVHLETSFGLKLPRLKERNVAPSTEPLPTIAPASLAALCAANAADRALYEKVDPVWDSALRALA